MKNLGLALLSIAFVGVLSCGGGGGSGSSQPSAGDGSGGSQQAPFTLSSSAFSDGGRIPQKHTCDGEDVNPPLTWSNPPQGTKSFVIVVDDPDAQQVAGIVWTHWVIYDIPATRTSIEEAFPKQADVNGIKRVLRTLVLIR